MWVILEVNMLYKEYLGFRGVVWDSASGFVLHESNTSVENYKRNGGMKCGGWCHSKKSSLFHPTKAGLVV